MIYLLFDHKAFWQDWCNRPIDYLIRCWSFGSWSWPWIFKVKYLICCISQNMDRLSRNAKRPYHLHKPWKFISITWWRHQMETFSALLAICAGNSPHKGQCRGAVIFFICVWMNGWVNNREASDLRRYRGHYDVTVMKPWKFISITENIPHAWLAA